MPAFSQGPHASFKALSRRWTTTSGSGWFEKESAPRIISPESLIYQEEGSKLRKSRGMITAPGEDAMAGRRAVLKCQKERCPFFLGGPPFPALSAPIPVPLKVSRLMFMAWTSGFTHAFLLLFFNILTLFRGYTKTICNSLIPPYKISYYNGKASGKWC